MTDLHRVLRATGYPAALMLAVVPLVEGLMQAWPPTLGSTQWRYGLGAYVGANLVLPTLGGLLALITASMLGHRRVLRSLSVVVFAGAVCLLVTAGLFVVDWWTVRATIAPELRRQFDITGLTAATNLGLSVLVLTWGALGGIRGSRRKERSEGHEPGIVSRGGTGTGGAAAKG